jgi:hypothetical protein
VDTLAEVAPDGDVGPVGTVATCTVVVVEDEDTVLTGEPPGTMIVPPIDS